LKNLRNIALLLTLTLIILISTSYGPAKARGYNVKIEKDITYVNAKKPHFKQRLDVYYPDGLKNAPVYLFIHGGGWKKGDKRRYTRLGRHYAKNGFATVVISYRLAPDFKHPSQIKDAASAFAWTYRNIRKYGGDPEKIFVSGHSAGGHLAALMTLDKRYLKAHNLSSNNIRGVIPIGGVYQIKELNIQKRWGNRSRGAEMLEKLFGPVFGTDRSLWKEASPVEYARKDIPPMLMLYGEKEPPYLRAQAKLLKRALDKKGAPVELKVIPGKGHIVEISDVGKRGDKTSPIVLEFIRKILEK